MAKNYAITFVKCQSTILHFKMLTWSTSLHRASNLVIRNQKVKIIIQLKHSPTRACKKILMILISSMLLGTAVSHDSTITPSNSFPIYLDPKPISMKWTGILIKFAGMKIIGAGSCTSIRRSNLILTPFSTVSTTNLISGVRIAKQIRALRKI